MNEGVGLHAGVRADLFIGDSAGVEWIRLGLLGFRRIADGCAEQTEAKGEAEEGLDGFHIGVLYTLARDNSLKNFFTTHVEGLLV